MPGVIVHLIAGSSMFLIGWLYYSKYFETDQKSKELLILAFVCLVFSILPDFVLAIYYTTYFVSFETALFYHDLVSIILLPIAIISLFTLKYLLNFNRKHILIIGIWCILLHIGMDLFIEESGIWI